MVLRSHATVVLALALAFFAGQDSEAGGHLWIGAEFAGEGHLYRYDIATGQVNVDCTLALPGATHWNNVAADGSFIYIGSDTALVTVGGAGNSSGYLWLGAEYAGEGSYYRYNLAGGVIDRVCPRTLPAGAEHWNNMATDGVSLYIGAPNANFLGQVNGYNCDTVSDFAYTPAQTGRFEDGAYRLFGSADPLELIVRFVWAGLDSVDISPILRRWICKNADRFDYPLPSLSATS